jgi:hypothetical protein
MCAFYVNADKPSYLLGDTFAPGTSLTNQFPCILKQY